MLCAGTACNADVNQATATPTELVIITATLPATQTPPPSPTQAPATATLPFTPVEGQTSSQLNVRDRPSASGGQLGTVNIFAKVQIVGKDPSGDWWMIVYPESPGGTGWITAQYVQVQDASGVPVIGEQPGGASSAPTGEPGPTTQAGSPGVPSPVPTLTLATAPPDGDAPQSPAVNVTLSRTSVETFSYSSDISSPEGDGEDWLMFKLEGGGGGQMIVTVVLDCSGSSQLKVELIQNNVLLDSWGDVSCEHVSALQLYLFEGAPYLLRLSPAAVNNPVNYVAYTVTVKLEK